MCWVGVPLEQHHASAGKLGKTQTTTATRTNYFKMQSDDKGLYNLQQKVKS